MPVGTGLDTQFGMKAEVTYGTPVTVDAFTYINNESIKADVTKIESPHLGTVIMRTSQVKTVVTGAAGSIELPFFNKGMGAILRQCFGSVTDTQVGATAEWTHDYRPEITNGKRGIMATVQVNRASVDGVNNPFTYEGGKITAFEVALAEKGLLTLKTDWVFEDEKTATGLAAASYATNLDMFDWSKATVTWGGVTVFVKSFSVKAEWTLDDDRRGLSQALRKEPLMVGMLAITGEMAGEFEALTRYADFTAGTQRQLIFTVTGTTIPTTANPYKVVITLDDAELTGDTPNVGGPQIIEHSMPFRALYDGTNPAYKLVTHNDTTSGS